MAMLPLVLLHASLLLLRLRLMKGFDSLAHDAICTTTTLEQKQSHSLCAFAFFPLEGGWGSFLSSFRTKWHGHHPVLELAIGPPKTSARLRTFFPVVGYLPRPGQPSVHSI